MATLCVERMSGLRSRKLFFSVEKKSMRKRSLGEGRSGWTTAATPVAAPRRRNGVSNAIIHAPQSAEDVTCVGPPAARICFCATLFARAIRQSYSFAWSGSFTLYNSLFLIDYVTLKRPLACGHRPSGTGLRSAPMDWPDAHNLSLSLSENKINKGRP